MAHIVKCRICHIALDTDKEPWVMPSKNFYYHAQCYEDFGKMKGSVKEGNLTIELDNSKWLDLLYDYLKKDLKMPLDWNKMKSQWDNFLKKGMTAKGIYFTLRYFYDIANGDPSKSEGGIGIVPLIYNEGTSYWGERNQRDKGICDRIEQQILKAREQSLRIVLQRETIKVVPDIDLASIADMADEEE